MRQELIECWSKSVRSTEFEVGYCIRSLYSAEAFILRKDEKQQEENILPLEGFPNLGYFFGSEKKSDSAEPGITIILNY